MFTPRWYISLPGLERFGLSDGFPIKDQMANSLVPYVAHFKFQVKLDMFLLKLNKNDSRFELTTNHEVLKAKQVVIAAGAFQKPFIPPIITEGEGEIFQLHSSDYVSPNQIPEGSVLVVGGGNSGAQIAVELAQER